MAGMTLLLVSGCTTGKGGDAGTGTAGGTSGANTFGSSKAAGNMLRYPLTTDPTTLDPAVVRDGTTIDLLQQVYEGLVKWDDKNNIAPGLAEKWDVSPDGVTYTFHLRHGVKFHKNGREVTAHDFKYSIERACNPDTNSPIAANYLGDIKGASALLQHKKEQGTAPAIDGVKVVDPYTLQITLDGFKPYWLGNMTYLCSAPVCKEEIDKTGGAVTIDSAIGAGPFQFKSYDKRNAVTLEANPNYYEGRPKLEGIYRPIMTDGSTRLNSYAAGELDIVELSPSDLDRVNGDANLKPDLKSFARAATWYIGLNQDAADSPFKKRDVRRAFAMAIDREAIVKVVLKGQADAATGIVPPHLGDYVSNCKMLPYDPAQAKKLLAQAGYPDGKGFPKLPIAFRNDLVRVQATAENVAQQLKENLGVDMQPQPMTWDDMLKVGRAKTLPILHQRWGADYNDPQNYLSLLLHTSKKVNGKDDHEENEFGYSNPQYDALCDKADVEHDHARRMAMYQQAEQIAIDDAPWVPVYFQRDLELVRPRVQNLRDSLFGHLPHLTTTVQ